MLKKTIVAGAVAAALGSGLAQAADPEPASPHTLTGNVGIFSQYIFRGLTQTDRNPAIQGGFDYSHSSGFYAGTWASNISWLKENASTGAFTLPGVGTVGPTYAGTYGQGGSMEWDFYGGYKWGFAPDWTLDVGTLYYYYPGKINPIVQQAFRPNDVPKADTWEIYAGLSWKWLSAKYSYSVDDKTFGVADASGTYYLDLSANIPLGDFSKDMTGLTVILHWGTQHYSGSDPRNFVVGGRRMSNDDMFSYNDWKVGLTYALPKDFTVGAYYTSVDSYNKLGYGGVGDVVPGVGTGPFPRDIAKDQFTVFVQKTF